MSSGHHKLNAQVGFNSGKARYPSGGFVCIRVSPRFQLRSEVLGTAVAEFNQRITTDRSGSARVSAVLINKVDPYIMNIGVEEWKGSLPGSCRRRPRVWPLIAVILGLGFLLPLHSASLVDLFANREKVNSTGGRVTGSNIGATLELREPQHGGKPGGHSVWISWQAPSDGILTLDTAGSDFDTLLGVYNLEAGDKPPMERLKEVARGDDNGNSRAALVEFGVRAGRTYEIAVDGFAGATGSIRLDWKLLKSDDPPPILLNFPPDRALQLGETLTLSVDYQAVGPVKLAWFFNNVELPGQEGASLVIPNFQVENVGLYALRFTAGGQGGGNIRFFTPAVEIQINSEGLTATLARDKLQDAPGSGLKSDDDTPGTVPLPVPLGARGRAHPLANPIGGLARGYNGTQIFSTLFATRDPAEPNHCNVVGGASYWFAYQAPTNGVVTLDTIGSTFDTVLAVYTFDGEFLGYVSLKPVACDNNGAPDGLRSRLQFTAEAGRDYLAVVDGVNGARGISHLNYTLEPTSPITAPQITNAPPRTVARTGSTVVLGVGATGTLPLHFQWSREGQLLPGETNEVLTLPAVTVEAAGAYRVEIANAAGKAVSNPLTVAVWSPPESRGGVGGAPVTLQFTASAAVTYTVEFSCDLATLWVPWTGPIQSVGGVVTIPLSEPGGAMCFLRVQMK